MRYSMHFSMQLSIPLSILITRESTFADGSRDSRPAEEYFCRSRLWRESRSHSEVVCEPLFTLEKGTVEWFLGRMWIIIFDGNDCSIPEADVNRSSHQRRELWHDSWAGWEYFKWWEWLLDSWGGCELLFTPEKGTLEWFLRRMWIF